MDSENEIRERLAAIEQDGKSVHRRLDNLEKLVEDVHTIAVETKAMREDVNGITERVNEIERRPGKRIETAITAIITAIVGIVIGHFLQI